MRPTRAAVVLITRHRLVLAAAAMVFAAMANSAAQAEESPGPRASTTYSYSILHSRAPAPVVDSARAHLVRWMGQELVERHLTLDSTASSYIAPPLHTASEPGSPVAALSGAGSAASVLPQPGWRLKFRLRDPAIPCADQPVVVHLDAAGTLIGVSSAVAFDAPEPGCAFTVGRDRAVDLARNDGLAAGVKPWQVQLSWVSRYERFAWSLSNTIEDGGVCSSHGETYIIDAKTGAVLERSSWSRRC